MSAAVIEEAVVIEEEPRMTPMARMEEETPKADELATAESAPLCRKATSCFE